jgi:biopolymer transport protein ExbB
MNFKKNLRQGLLGLLIALPLFAHAGEEWAHKKKLSIDTTASGVELKEGASQMPLLLRLHSGNFAFSEAAPDGADLRFFAADGKTPLRYHLETFDATNELAIVWVQIPKLAANTKTDSILMQWGNPKAVSASDPKGTYDATQVLAFHFSDKGDQDSTGNANHAKEFGVKLNTAGPIGNAAMFDGANRILLPASPTLKMAGNTFSYTAWVKPVNDRGTLFKQIDGKRSLSIELSKNILSVLVDGAALATTAALKPGVWQHVAVVAGAGKVGLYVDGANIGSSDFTLPELAGDVSIGEGFIGEMDEIGIASSTRSADYIKALSASQSAESLLVAFAEDDESGGESASYIGILLGALTVDGWVVIFILLIMGVVSFGVMISKTLFLSRTNKANDAFLEHFRNKPDELLTPGTAEASTVSVDDGVKHSPIYRLYAIGLREIQHRFEAQSKLGETNSLSGTALNAIRASMDAGMVRESQRLNSQIVLLTIAISGGPFLGLLGTVVGVMITFAAIAAAGDVNVNSIAPGIAAALVATVAGLAVAIPALFGYNWLAIQIKNVSSDTQVFADEFLAKAAELHSA